MLASRPRFLGAARLRRDSCGNMPCTLCCLLKELRVALLTNAGATCRADIIMLLGANACAQTILAQAMPLIVAECSVQRREHSTLNPKMPLETALSVLRGGRLWRANLPSSSGSSFHERRDEGPLFMGEGDKNKIPRTCFRKSWMCFPKKCTRCIAA